MDCKAHCGISSISHSEGYASLAGLDCGGYSGPRHWPPSDNLRRNSDGDCYWRLHSARSNAQSHLECAKEYELYQEPDHIVWGDSALRCPVAGLVSHRRNELLDYSKYSGTAALRGNQCVR